jgi:hypothetical protein
VIFPKPHAPRKWKNGGISLSAVIARRNKETDLAATQSQEISASKSPIPHENAKMGHLKLLHLEF